MTERDLVPVLPASLASLANPLAAYLAEVKARSGSARTHAEYGRILNHFFSLVAEHGWDPLALTSAHVHRFAYEAGATGREPSAGTVAMRLNAVKGFYDFARRMGVVTVNPAGDVKRPKAERPTPRGLSADELRRLLAAILPTPAGMRDRAIILTTVLTGLRRSEVMSLRKADLTRNGAVYYHVRAKGGLYRHRELPAPAFAAIVTALNAEGRSLGAMADDEALFEVSAHGWYLNLKRYARKAKLEGVTPHALRHSAAKLRRDAGATIEEVQALLGHSSIATTARYLARLEGAEDEGWQPVALALGLSAEQQEAPQ
jgi:site-specific recombinase XerD